MMKKLDIIKEIFAKGKELLELLADLGGSFNQDTLNIAEKIGLNISNPFYAFLINLGGLYLLYKLSIKMTDSVLLNLIKGILALLFLVMAGSLLLN